MMPNYRMKSRSCFASLSVRIFNRCSVAGFARRCNSNASSVICKLYVTVTGGQYKFASFQKYNTGALYSYLQKAHGIWLHPRYRNFHNANSLLGSSSKDSNEVQGSNNPRTTKAEETDVQKLQASLSSAKQVIDVLLTELNALKASDSAIVEQESQVTLAKCELNEPAIARGMAEAGDVQKIQASLRLAEQELASPFVGINKIQGSKSLDATKATEQAEDFVKAIMADYDKIPDKYCSGMSVLRNVVDLESGGQRDVVVRNITEAFWQACIDMVDTPDKRYRVCAVGTPGIGKTHVTSVLIRMLLKSKQTVIYHIRTDAKSGWFYEFKYSNDSGMITTKLYSEKTELNDIESLRHRSTYYVVDPGRTKDDCNPGDLFPAKTILVSSPDDCHWGKSEFAKRRGSVKGFFMYYPIWTLDEMLNARSCFGLTLDEKEVKQRYYQFGGVPRHVFTSDVKELETTLEDQILAVNGLSEGQALQIAKGEVNAVQTQSDKQPKSALIGYQLLDNSSFDKVKVVVISLLVKEKIYTKFIKVLWSLILDPRYKNWEIFEIYTYELMANGKSAHYEYRECATIDTSDNSKDKKYGTLELGGCTSKRQVDGIVEAAKATPDILFHSHRQFYELIDFIYQDSDHVFHAFQATIAATHKAETAKINNLQEKVGVGEKLRLYYLVPGEKFGTFNTDPVNPKKKDSSISCNIWIVAIPNPNKSDPLIV